MFKHNFSGGGAYVRRVLLKSAATVLLIFIFTTVAGAYTLVFRSGQRIEIPDEFTVTRNTVTYELAPGFNKTIWVSLIDVPATERANKEAPGSFFKHKQDPNDPPQTAPQQASQQAPQQPSQPAVRTLTNDDLVAFRQRRIESEKAYEKRRLELGLPTVAETRMRQQQDEMAFRDQVRNRKASEKREEAYWRSRARELRTEIAAVDYQINYVRSRVKELDDSSFANRPPIVTEVYPINPTWRWPRNRGNNNGNQNPQYPYGYPNQYPYGYPNGYPPNGYPNQYPYGYPNQYPYGYPNGYPPNGYPNQYPYGYPNGYPNQYPYGYPNGYPNQYPYGYPNGQYPGSYDQSERIAQERAGLTTRLDDLLTKRAGLMAEWQALEDEARDARVPQAWLEP